MTALARLAPRYARLEPPRRSPGVDLARALAVIGMVAAHLTDTPELVWTDPRTWMGVVEGRSSILFATLAGVSLALATPRGTGRPGAGRLLAVRALLLWLLGLALVATLVPVYVILPAYGVLFLIAIGLLRLRTRQLVILAVLTAVLAPFAVAAVNAVADPDAPAVVVLSLLIGWNYPFVLWAAFLAAGIVAGRLLADEGTRGAPVLLAAGGILAVLGYALIGSIGDRAAAELERDPVAAGVGTAVLAVLQDHPHSSGVGEAIGSGGFALAVLALCVLICALPGRAVLWPLRALGSMPLTAYAAQLVAWAIWIRVRDLAGVVDGAEGASDTPGFWPMTIGLLGACSIWALLIGRGPLEMLVSRLSRELATRSSVTARRRPSAPRR